MLDHDFLNSAKTKFSVYGATNSGKSTLINKIFGG